MLRLTRPARALTGTLILSLALAACSQPATTDTAAPASPTAASPTTASTVGQPVKTAAATSTAANDQSYPATVSSCGRSFTYSKAPTRVVLGFPGTLSTLTALGVQDSVIGYTLGSFDALPTGYPTRIAEISPDYAPSREAMIAAQLDLYLANDEGQVQGQGTVSYDDLTGAGANVYVLGSYCADSPAPRSLDVVYSDITALGQIYGVPDQAAQVVDSLKARVATAANRKTTDLSVAFVQVADGKLYANSGYPVAGIIDALGLTNSFADLPGNFTELSQEAALTRTPDVLFVDYQGQDNEAAAIAQVKTLMLQSPAVRNNRVYGSNSADYQAGGVAIVEHLEDIANKAFSS